MEQKVTDSAAAEPDISVIIPAHDAAPGIGQALDSVARQEGLSAEVIVVDDASRDGTAELVEAWGRAHPSLPLRLVRREKQAYALRARLAGLELARARDVIFLDADDSWAGTRRLGRMLAQKRRLECEIIHFRTTGFLDGKNVGELLWTAPPLGPSLAGKEIFATYARKEYIPLQLWNKIYSQSLLQKAARLVGKSEIFYFDDKFFVSLVLMCADSWAAGDEYIYQYNLRPEWPLEKSAKCAHDLIEIRKKAEAVFPVLGIDAPARQDYLNFIDKRLTYHLGRLSISVEKCLYEGSAPRDVLDSIAHWLPISGTVPALVASTQKNVQRILQISRRIHEKF